MGTLLTGLLIISAIAALLALLLELADSYIADYGVRKISINDEKELEVQGGRPILTTLGEEGVFVPSACGGKGTCGYCKVTIREGGGPLLPTERPYLSPEEVAGSVRLACQVKVKEDLRLEMPEEYFLIREYRARVERIVRHTGSIKGVILKILEPEEGITFIPGQYLQVEVPRYELSSAPEFRAYSIASDAEEHRRVELLIGKVEGGLVSTYVHDFLKEGDELLCRGPFGAFHLIESDREILLVAGGTGLAPILSLLRQMEREGIERKATLYFGARTAADLFYMEELKAFEKKLPRFVFVPALSRPRPEDGWTGETGRVTALIERDVADNAPVDAHLCGAPAMVKSCVEILEKKGIPADNIAFDKFE
jgi:Na+-transporting NADH:ubiquinone oxidoreductase subunit F